MKTRPVQSFGLGLALSVLPFVAGCNQQPGGAPKSSTNVTAQAPAALPATSTDLPSIIEPATAPTPPPEKTIPANIKPSPPLGEIIKLANAGVEEGVLLAYVNGSQSAFNLGSDEIIYLTDIGVSDAVVTAMMERDQFLKQPWSPPTQTATPEVAITPEPEQQEQEELPVAAAPTYVEPPESYPVEQPQQVVNDNYFYDNLAPYGSWTQLDGYGWCWQPTVVVLNRSWQPYCDRGRWAYTDCGWYWQSDYSWGATFHYGRWFNHPNRGWCWWPDRTWSPAWVTWRYNDNYCGWAPLPPRTYCRSGVGLAYYNRSVGVSFNFGLSANCYTFVTWRGLCDSHPSRHRLSHGQATTVINNTTIVNNIASGHNNTVVNRGITPDHVAEHAQRPVHRTTVRDAERRIAGNRSREHDDRDGRTFAARREQGRGADSTLPARTRGGNANNNNAGIGQFASIMPATTQPQSPATTVSAPPTGRPNADSRNSRDNGAPRFTQRTPNTPKPVSQPVQDPAPSTGRLNTDTRNSRNNETPGHGPSQGRDRTSPSLIVRGSDDADQPSRTSPAQNAPAGSLVVIGKRDDAQSRAQGRFTLPSSRNTFAYNQTQISVPQTDVQQPVAPIPQARTPMPNIARGLSAPAPAQSQRQDTPRFNQRAENRLENRPSNPMVMNRLAVPAYTPPISPQPAPQRFNPPAPATRPVPVNVAPLAQKVESQPASNPRAESAPQSSNSGGSGRGGGSGQSDRGDRQR